MFIINHYMVIYSSDHGSTLIDNFDEIFLDTEHELSSEIFDIEIDEDDSWSGSLGDMWSTDSDYQRPNIYC